jgi:hypothetical protein
MAEPRPEDDAWRAEWERRLEHWVHWTLLAGLSTSGLLLLAGLLASLAQGPTRPTTGPPPSPWAVLRGTTHGDPATILLDLGLLALLATPMLRVAALAVGWSLAGDWRFAGVALVVLSLLGLGLALGLG